MPDPCRGFPCGSAGKESACNAVDPGSISGSGRSPGEGTGYPRQYSGPKNSLDCIVHGVTKSQTQLSNFHFHFIFLGSKNHCWQWLQPWNWKTFTPWKGSYDHPRQHIKKQRHHFANKAPYTQSYDFHSSHAQMWELDHKEGWAPKNWCFWIVLVEKTLESLLDSKEIKPVNPKRNQPWIFTGRTDYEAPILRPPDAKSQLIEKALVLGDWRQEKRQQGMRWLDGITDSTDVNLSKL